MKIETKNIFIIVDNRNASVAENDFFYAKGDYIYSITTGERVNGSILQEDTGYRFVNVDTKNHKMALEAKTYFKAREEQYEKLAKVLSQEKVLPEEILAYANLINSSEEAMAH